MLTLQEIVQEQDTPVKRCVDNCIKNGVSYINRHAVEGVLRKSRIPNTKLSNYLHSELGIQLIYNDSHYIFSSSELRQDL